MKTFLSSKTFLFIIILVLLVALLFKIFFEKKAKSNSPELELKTFAFDIKEQLDSILRQRNESSPFKLDEAEIEVNFVVKNLSGKSGGLQYEIVTGDDKSKYEKESVQKMNLHFKFTKTKGK